MRRLALSIPVVAIVAVGLSDTLAAQSSRISVAEDRLTVRVSDAALVDIIDELVAIGAIAVVGRDRLAGNVTASFDAKAIHEAVAVLLADFNIVVKPIVPDPKRPGARWQVRIYSNTFFRTHDTIVGLNTLFNRGLVLTTKNVKAIHIASIVEPFVAGNNATCGTTLSIASPSTGDYGAKIIHFLGDLAAGASKTVTFRYRAP